MGLCFRIFFWKMLNGRSHHRLVWGKVVTLLLARIRIIFSQITHFKRGFGVFCSCGSVYAQWGHSFRNDFEHIKNHKQSVKKSTLDLNSNSRHKHANWTRTMSWGQYPLVDTPLLVSMKTIPNKSTSISINELRQADCTHITYNPLCPAIEHQEVWGRHYRHRHMYWHLSS